MGQGCAVATIEMKPTLSTLGCPDWPLETICDRAGEYGYEGVDFRGVRDEVDVTRTPAFADCLGESTELLDAADLAVTCLSSSIRICVAEDHDDHLAEARRYIDLAAKLDVPFVRVFGIGDADAHSLEELAAVGGETMDAITDLPGADEVTWVLETHDNWTRAEDTRLLLDHLPEETGVVWDVGHTTRVTGDAPADTLDALGDRIEYVHLKDAEYDPSHPDAMDDDWRYVLPGTGELPLAQAIDELDAAGYDGWVAFEHEKRWHRNLPDPEVACPAFVEWFESIR